MARWSDLAQWRGPTSNQGGSMVEVRGVVLHIAEGSYEGTISWQKNPSSDVSSHFVKGKVDGEEAQIVDTDTTAWTQAAGNGHWLSIENAGFVPDKLTASQVEFAAQVLARAHKVYGVPLQVTGDPNGRGLGHHSMGAPAWGHSACPGTNIINQKPAIVARAKDIVEGDDMPTGLIGLSKGDEGTEVRGLQNLLRRAGYDPGDSGEYDSKTTAAVLEMRQDMGSSATSGDTVNGDAYAQLVSAVAIAYAKQYAGEKGDPGPAGPPGEQGPPGPAPGQQFTVQAI